MKILYIHGMGGGEDSRIPSILKDRLGDKGVEVTVHTYDFDPDVASVQVQSWFEETRPDLVIGESLGTCHAMRLRGVPHIFISPAINAPSAMVFFSSLAHISLFRLIADFMFKVKRPNRQQLKFDPAILKHYRPFEFKRVSNIDDSVFAFFGSKDRYRLSGVVCVPLWRRTFGPESYAIYNGSHYMEEEFIDSLLIPKILSYR